MFYLQLTKFIPGRRILFRLFKYVLIIFLFIEVEHFCHKKTGGFALEKILSDQPNREEWQLTDLQKADAGQVKEILNQPFTFFGRGAQCYVFLSQDQNYVLKFFRFDHLRAPLWLTHLPIPFFLHAYRDKKIALNRGKTERTFQSYKIAFEQLREETGLVYVHLNKGHHLAQTTTIIDKLGIAHELDMDAMPFILQKRAKPIYPTIAKWMKRQNFEETKKAVSNLLQLLALRCKKGIIDKDPDICTNFGFIHGLPIQIDVGRFAYSGPIQNSEYYREEIIRITDKFNNWLRQNYPELSVFLEQQIQTLPFDAF